MNVLTHLLIVEDDPAIARSLRDGLEREGYRVTHAANGTDGIAYAQEHNPHSIILDVRLPDMLGFDVCRRLRELGLRQPIMMLTARQEEMDKVLGLEMGADDYVTKPFSPQELVSRVRAVLRRSKPMSAAETIERALAFADLVIDPQTRLVTIHGEEKTLTAKEFDLLSELIRHKGAVLSRDLLLERVWGYEFAGDTRTVDVHIRWLREKIEPDSAKPTRIVTVRGAGYRFEG